VGPSYPLHMQRTCERRWQLRMQRNPLAVLAVAHWLTPSGGAPTRGEAMETSIPPPASRQLTERSQLGAGKE
jgi:hypothetical protein